MISRVFSIYIKSCFFSSCCGSFFVQRGRQIFSPYARAVIDSAERLIIPEASPNSMKAHGEQLFHHRTHSFSIRSLIWVISSMGSTVRHSIRHHQPTSNPHGAGIYRAAPTLITTALTDNLASKNALKLYRRKQQGRMLETES